MGAIRGVTLILNLPIHNVVPFSDHQMISDEFNDFFLSIGPHYDYLKTPMTTCMFLKPIDEEEILKIINKLNQNKSAGHDDVGNFIVKRIAK